MHAMPVPLTLVMALQKLRRLPKYEAARRLGITLAELDYANTFAQVAFPVADPDVMPPSPPCARKSASACG